MGGGGRGINVEITSVMHNLNQFRVKRVIVISFQFSLFVYFFLPFPRVDVSSHRARSNRPN